MRIGSRIPCARIDPVQYADQRFAPVFEQTVETAAEFRRANFLRIAWTDRSDTVAIGDSALDEAQLAVKLERLRSERLRGQPQRHEIRIRKETLVGQVMDGEYAGRGLVSLREIGGH